MQEITQVVQRAVDALFGRGKLEVEAVGSYRRGKQMCGDVDVLITMKDARCLNNPSKYMTEKEELK